MKLTRMYAFLSIVLFPISVAATGTMALIKDGGQDETEVITKDANGKDEG